MAFTISSSQHLKALPNQYLGLFNATDLLGNLSTVRSTFAVEFDTVQDFEFGDINDNHIGIDIDSLRSNASVPAAYYPDDGSFTAKDLNLKCGKPIQVWIDYDSVGNVLNVTISPTSTKPRRPILSFPVDLSPIFEENMFVGFSASTGLLASSHYILGWSFKLNGQAQGLDLSSLPSLSNSNKSHQSLTIGITVAFVFTAICILSFALAYLVRKKIRNREDQIEDWELGIRPQRYSYSEF
ncbi:L-type lectin-domain containing receptor kinase S.4 [Linum grandiflorum]